MRVVTRELWPGHKITTLIVKRWRPIYGRFNRVFAIASRRREVCILDEPFYRTLHDTSATTPR